MGDPIQVAVIGCGNFARGMHLPNIEKIPTLRLRATCDLVEPTATAESQRYAADYATDDPERVFSDDQIDLCIITTPHDTHAPLTLQALEAGKHVLVEKPMCVTPPEVDEILLAAADAGVVYTAGHNRRYSPLSERALELLGNQPRPWVLSYRMVDQKWIHPWALDPEIGGGRLISEAGHIFEVLYFLIGSEPVRIHAHGGALTHANSPVKQDNAVLTVAFEDGSLAAVVHGDIGHKDLSKESIEIFANGAVVVIDDFQAMRAFGLGDGLDITLKAQDKGHLRELELLAEAILAGGRMPVDAAAAARAMSCCFAAMDSIRTGSPIDLDASAWLMVERGTRAHPGTPDLPVTGDTSY